MLSPKKTELSIFALYERLYFNKQNARTKLCKCIILAVFFVQKKYRALVKMKIF